MGLLPELWTKRDLDFGYGRGGVGRGLFDGTGRDSAVSEGTSLGAFIGSAAIDKLGL